MSGNRLIGYKDDNRRRDVRVKMSGLRFIVGGKEFTVIDLSVGGFSLAKAIGRLKPGQKFTISHVHTEDEGRFPLNAAAEVARVDYAATALGCRFGRLTDGQFRIVEALAMRRPVSNLGGTVKKKGFFGLFGD